MQEIFTEKYRPQEFKDVVGIDKQIISDVESGSIPHYLFVGSAGCLKKGTLVKTPFGDKPIEECNAVYSYNFEKEQFQIKSCVVIPTIKKKVIVTFNDGSSVECSNIHPFYSTEDRYIQAKDLKVGDTLYHYEIERLHNMWNTDKAITESRKNKEVLFDTVLFSLEKEESNQSVRTTEPNVEGSGQSANQTFVCKRETEHNKNIFITKCITECCDTKIKEDEYQHQRFQETSENRNTKEGTSRNSKSEISRKIEPSIYSRKQGWTKEKQEKIFRDSKKQLSVEMLQLFNTKDEHGFMCSSYRWGQYEQQCKELSDTLPRLSCNTSSNEKHIVSIEQTEEVEEMFDLIVPDNNNFFLSNGILTHNTGKTTTAKIIVKKLNADVLELNASRDRGIDIIRDKIIPFCQKQSDTIKIVFLDEFDGTTPNFQFSLRNVMETYAKTTRFVATCNYLTKIIEPIQSRFNIYQFQRYGQKDKKERLAEICELEKIDYDLEILDKLIVVYKDDIRSMINFLQKNKDSKISTNMVKNNSTALRVLTMLKNNQWLELRQELYEVQTDYIQLLISIDEVVFNSDKLSVGLKQKTNNIVAKYLDMLYRSFDHSITFGAFAYELEKILMEET